MTAHPQVTPDPTPPPVEQPILCAKCGAEFTEGQRAVYVTLNDGTNRWISTCRDCLAAHPPTLHPAPVRLKRIK